jgi:hypothetical protein
MLGSVGLIDSEVSSDSDKRRRLIIAAILRFTVSSPLMVVLPGMDVALTTPPLPPAVATIGINPITITHIRHI